METRKTAIPVEEKFPKAISVGETVEQIKAEDLLRAMIPTKVAHLRIRELELKTANKEYSHQLTIGCKRFKIQCRDGTAVRVATMRDIVAGSNPGYWTLQAAVATGCNGQVWEEDNLDIRDPNMILYFACGSADKFLEIIEGF